METQTCHASIVRYEWATKEMSDIPPDALLQRLPDIDEWAEKMTNLKLLCQAQRFQNASAALERRRGSVPGCTQVEMLDGSPETGHEGACCVPPGGIVQLLLEFNAVSSPSGRTLTAAGLSPDAIAFNLTGEPLGELTQRLRKPLVEHYLFHGTSPENAKAIAANGFRRIMAGSNAGTAFGRGCYFAEALSKSDECAQCDEQGQFVILLCRVEFPALAALSKCFRRSGETSRIRPWLYAGADVGWQSRDWPRENQSLVLQSMAPGVSEKMWYSPKPAIGSWVIKLLEASGNLSTQKGAEFVMEFGLIGCSQALATPDCAGNFSLGTLWVAQSLSLVGTTLSPSPTLLQFDVEASSDCSPPRQTGGGWC
ncbi:unnamed protein product [Cladocopium goreaui]|uniref:Poly [ADP-ribose] polymerase (PARP) n=1 Tax=Cladocopium goreaui TaxID=2562237 RepID=A0A9P1FID2_9DINO|nr:unnamed protein product [Cladocopium goreaui]